MMKEILGIIILTILVSCGRNIKFEEILKSESVFELTIKQTDNLDSKKFIIENNSDKFLKLKKWFEAHPDNWESSIASWAIADISLISDNFRLLVFKDFVVVGFTDKSGKPRQYTKDAEKSEFNFLTEKE